jgi:hypothetical protein
MPGGDENAYKILAGKPEETISFMTAGSTKIVK